MTIDLDQMNVIASRIVLGIVVNDMLIFKLTNFGTKCAITRLTIKKYLKLYLKQNAKIKESTPTNRP